MLSDWLRDHEPALPAASAALLSDQAYVLVCRCGRPQTEPLRLLSPHWQPALFLDDNWHEALPPGILCRLRLGVHEAIRTSRHTRYAMALRTGDWLFSPDSLLKSSSFRYELWGDYGCCGFTPYGWPNLRCRCERWLGRAWTDCLVWRHAQLDANELVPVRSPGGRTFRVLGEMPILDEATLRAELARAPGEGQVLWLSAEVSAERLGPRFEELMHELRAQALSRTYQRSPPPPPPP